MEGSKEKRWRLTEDEFKQKAITYLRNHLEVFTDELEQRVHSDSQCNYLYNMYKNYKKKQYNSIEMEICSIMNILEYDLYDWRRFSQDINSKPEDIMLRMLINKIYNCDYVCKLFVSSNPNLPEEFFEDCIFVNSRFFKFEDWDDIHVSTVTGCAANMCSELKDENMVKLYSVDNLGYRSVPMPFDAIEMCSGKSDAFRNKYEKLRIKRLRDLEEKEEEKLC